MTGVCGDFAIFLVPNGGCEWAGMVRQVPPFSCLKVSRYVSLCPISRFSGLMGEAGQTLP